MPPIRTMSSVKPVKTERTHEENQERAYIAASRRSDRSLEARIESARRASEIHKRRTGRSLRVTEQDVVNEEMYEEEDDDLPLQYRRLTAHLNTNSSDFNRRLAAYLSNHVAMRTALDQAISNSYAQQQQQQSQPSATASQWAAPNTPLMSGPGPWAPGQNPQYPSQLSQYMASRQPNTIRQSPYPTPATKSQCPTLKSQQSNSSTNSRPSASGRRSSHSPSAGSPSVDRTDRSLSTPSLPDVDEDSHATTSAPPPTYAPSYSQPWANPSPTSISPLTTNLPPETQMFFGAGFGNMDSFGNHIGPMDKSEQPLFSYDNHLPNHRSHYPQPYLNGMSQTLAPEALNQADFSQWTSSADGVTAHSPVFNNGLDPNFQIGPFAKDSFGFDDPRFTGQLTPGDNDWSAFIDTNSWDDRET